MKPVKALAFFLLALLLTTGVAFSAPIDVGNIASGDIYNFNNTDPITLNENAFDDLFSTRTASFWFNTADADQSQMIYEEGGRYNGANIFIMDGEVTVGAWRSSGSVSGAWMSTPTTSNQWHNVAYVFDQGTFSLYYNGSPVQPSASLGFSAIPAHSGADAVGGVNGRTLSGPDGGSDQISSELRFNGSLAGITFDDSAFNAAQIANLAAATNPVPIPNAMWLLGSGIVGLALFRSRKE